MPVVRAVRRALPAALVLALALPAGAHAAATLSVSGTTPTRTLTFTATDGIDHATAPYVLNGNLRIDDPGGISVISGCTPVDADTVECGPTNSYTRLSFVFGAGDDVLTVYYEFTIPVTVEGGAGNDYLKGGNGADTLEGGDGNDDLFAAGGADTIHGGAGTDEISGGLGADTIDGGAGDDFIGAWDWAADAGPVVCGPGMDNVDFDYALDTVADDCEIRPPHIDAPPTLSGQPTVGMTLTRSTPPASAGAVTDSLTYWEHCDRSGYPCSDTDDVDQDESYTLTAEDVGYRVRVIYYVGNTAGYDGSASDLTAVVGSVDAVPMPVAPAPLPAVELPVARIAPKAFAVTGAPAVTMRGATAIVDSGRTVACPAGLVACQLSVTARPGGSSARVRGRPALAGTAQIKVRAGSSAKIVIRLTPKAARMLRSKHRITLAVSAILKRGPVQHATASFAVTVKGPARGKH